MHIPLGFFTKKTAAEQQSQKAQNAPSDRLQWQGLQQTIPIKKIAIIICCEHQNIRNY